MNTVSISLTDTEMQLLTQLGQQERLPMSPDEFATMVVRDYLEDNQPMSETTRKMIQESFARGKEVCGGGAGGIA